MPSGLRRAIVDYLFLKPRASADDIKSFSTKWLHREFGEASLVPTGDMITGIRHRLAKNQRLANTDMESCKVFLREWTSQNPGDSMSIEYVKNNDGDQKILIFGQTAHMRSMSAIYGRYIIGLDSTHKVGVHAIPFYLMMVRDCFGHGQIVGFFMLVCLFDFFFKPHLMA
jgi:hypothetical protein